VQPVHKLALLSQQVVVVLVNMHHVQAVYAMFVLLGNINHMMTLAVTLATAVLWVSSMLILVLLNAMNVQPILMLATSVLPRALIVQAVNIVILVHLPARPLFHLDVRGVFSFHCEIVQFMFVFVCVFSAYNAVLLVL
jgi:hypothetical protein